MLIQIALCALLAGGCASGALPEPKAPSTLPEGDPCRLDLITVYAEECGQACDQKPEAEREACRAACDQRIDERCKQ